MALYQRGQVWYADYYVQGRRIQESTGTRDRRKAEKLYAVRLADIQRGTFALPSKVTFAEFGKRYLEHAKIHKRSWIRDEQMFRKLDSFFKDKALTEVNVVGIEQYKVKRAAEVSPATVNRELALLKHMFNLAEQWESFNGKNPVRFVRFLAENNHKFRSLSESEEEELLKFCSPYLQDLVAFAINTGLRFGEILNLKWEEVDLEEGSLRFLVPKNRRILEVPLNEQALRVVRAWHGMRKCPFVFYNPATGERFKDLRLGLKKACRESNVEDVTWHTFRHTFASRLTQRGVDLVTVKELLGHSDVSVTMRYAHTNRATKARAVKLLNSDKIVTIEKKENESD